MAVYVSNLTVNTGTTFSQIFTLESADTNSATDLTGFTASAQMRKHPGASSATDFTTQIINASGGITTTWNNKHSKQAGHVVVSSNKIVHKKILGLLKPIV